MKKITLLLTTLTLFSCATYNNIKNNEEFQYYDFNEKAKSIVDKSDIYITKVTKTETFSNSVSNIKSKENVKLVGSWDFSQAPSKTIQHEINNKATHLGANHIVIFEKKNCQNTSTKDSTPATQNCYNILYYYVPELASKTPNKKPEINAAPKAPEPVN
jgi:hypothetical protein